MSAASVGGGCSNVSNSKEPAKKKTKPSLGLMSFGFVRNTNTSTLPATDVQLNPSSSVVEVLEDVPLPDVHKQPILPVKNIAFCFVHNG